jgi:hypothetical protein
MVGGSIKEIIPDAGGDLWVNCAGTDCERGMECAVYIAATAEPLAVGDWFWWQGDWAYWTPKDRSRTDVKLKRTSYSGVSRPRGRGGLE